MTTADATANPSGRPQLPCQLEGGCHCGRVQFSVTIRSYEASLCNCSICQMKGNLARIVAAQDFVLKTGEDMLRRYTFNTGTAQHLFCGTCGIHAFYVPRSHPDSFSVNVRCLHLVNGVAPATWFEVKAFDGQNWERNVAEFRSQH